MIQIRWAASDISILETPPITQGLPYIASTAATGSGSVAPAETESSHAGISNGAKIGIGLGVVFGVFLPVLLGLLLWRWRLKRRRDELDDDFDDDNAVAEIADAQIGYRSGVPTEITVNNRNSLKPPPIEAKEVPRIDADADAPFGGSNHSTGSETLVHQQMQQLPAAPEPVVLATSSTKSQHRRQDSRTPLMDDSSTLPGLHSRTNSTSNPISSHATTRTEDDGFDSDNDDFDPEPTVANAGALSDLQRNLQRKQFELQAERDRLTRIQWLYQEEQRLRTRISDISQ
jgi:hypothetical protein